jgi:hypothetical protein
MPLLLLLCGIVASVAVRLSYRRFIPPRSGTLQLRDWGA